MSDTCTDRITARIRRMISRSDAWVFGVSFCMTLAVHLYVFTNKFINHDDVNGLYDTCAFGLSSGRFSLHLMSRLTGAFSSAWLNGILGALFLSIGVTAVLKLFDVKHRLTALPAAFVMVTVPTVVSTYTYMFCAYQYFFAMAAACVGAYWIRREKLPWMAAGALLIAFGMGCYQAYFGLAAALLVTVLILDLLRCRWEGRALPCFLAGLRYVGSLAAAMGAYFLILRICLAVTGTALTEYQGIDGMGRVSLSGLFGRIGDAYQRFGSFYYNNRAYQHPVFLTVLACLCAVLGLTAVILAVVRGRRRLTWGTAVLLVLLLSLFPLSCNLAYVMTDHANVHMVMVYPTVMLFLLPVLAAEHFPVRRAEGGDALPPRRWEGALVCVMLAVTLLVGFEGAVTANSAYFAMDMTEKNVSAFYTKLTAKLELQPGFTSDTTIAFLGRVRPDDFTSGPDITGVLIGKPAYNLYSRFQYLYYFLGSNYRFADAETKEALRQTDTYVYMPCYPDEGSIQWIDGILTVKLSEDP